MKENDLFMQEALGNLDPELLEESEKVMTKKRRPAPVRVMMVAACVCALLVGAVAAGVLDFGFVRIFGENDEERIVRGTVTKDDGEKEMIELEALYHVDGSGLVPIPVEKLSPAIQEVQEEYPEGWHAKRLGFDSWAEAEEFIGYDFADNDILDQVQKYARITFGKGDQAVTGNCFALVYVNDGELHSVGVFTMYNLMCLRYDDRVDVREWNRDVVMVRGGDHTENTTGVTVTVNASFYTRELPESPGLGFGGNDYYTVEGQESYLTANGLETVIVHLKDVPGEYDREGGAYHAFFFLRGVRFMVEAGYHQPETQELVLIGLKQILDAYQ